MFRRRDNKKEEPKLPVPPTQYDDPTCYCHVALPLEVNSLSSLTREAFIQKLATLFRETSKIPVDDRCNDYAINEKLLAMSEAEFLKEPVPKRVRATFNCSMQQLLGDFMKTRVEKDDPRFKYMSCKLFVKVDEFNVLMNTLNNRLIHMGVDRKVKTVDVNDDSDQVYTFWERYRDIELDRPLAPEPKPNLISRILTMGQK